MWSNTARRTKIVAVASGVVVASLIGAQANAAPSATPQILPLNADDLLVSRLAGLRRCARAVDPRPDCLAARLLQ
jgi:hypothetical protein